MSFVAAKWSPITVLDLNSDLELSWVQLIRLWCGLLNEYLSLHPHHYSIILQWNEYIIKQDLLLQIVMWAAVIFSAYRPVLWFNRQAEAAVGHCALTASRIVYVFRYSQGNWNILTSDQIIIISSSGTRFALQTAQAMLPFIARAELNSSCTSRIPIWANERQNQIAD